MYYMNGWHTQSLVEVLQAITSPHQRHDHPINLHHELPLVLLRHWPYTVLVLQKSQCFIAIFRVLHNSNASDFDVGMWDRRRVPRLRVMYRSLLVYTHFGRIDGLAITITEQQPTLRHGPFFVSIPNPSITSRRLPHHCRHRLQHCLSEHFDPHFLIATPVYLLQTTQPQISRHIGTCTRRQLPSVPSHIQGLRIQSTLLMGVDNGVFSRNGIDRLEKDDDVHRLVGWR
jgi:hypothetical protein